MDILEDRWSIRNIRNGDSSSFCHTTTTTTSSSSSSSLFETNDLNPFFVDSFGEKTGRISFEDTTKLY